MDGNLIYLFAAAVVVWIAVFLYLLSLSGRLAALRRELDALKPPEAIGDDAGQTATSGSDHPPSETHDIR